MMKDKRKGNQMKKLLLPLLLFLVIGCENNITGIDNRPRYEDVSFTVEEYGLNSWNWWRVNLIVINTSNELFLRPWHIEVDFYKDSTFSTFCQHVRAKVDEGLYPGDTLKVSISTHGRDCLVDEDDYLTCAVTNIQAYK